MITRRKRGRCVFCNRADSNRTIFRQLFQPTIRTCLRAPRGCTASAREGFASAARRTLLLTLRMVADRPLTTKCGSRGVLRQVLGIESA